MPWHDRRVTTVLQYLVIAAVIGLVVFGLAIFVFGRGEQLAPLPPRTSPTELPDQGMTAEDVRKVRFAMAPRGYRMSDVDWALERMADELDRLRAEIAALSGGQAPDRDPAPDDRKPTGDPSEGNPEPDADNDDGAVLAGAARTPPGRGERPATDPIIGAES